MRDTHTRLTTAMTMPYSPQLMQASTILRLGRRGLAAFLHETSGINPCLHFHAPNSMYFDAMGESENDDFRNRLQEKLSELSIPTNHKEAAMMIIDHLDDNGFATWSAQLQSEMHAQFGTETINAALTHVQSLGPHGIAARDLAECLLLQLQAIDSAPHDYSASVMQTAKDIVQNRLHWFLRRRFDKLPRRNFHAVTTLLESLSHCPSAALTTNTAALPDDVADIEFYQEHGLWKVRTVSGIHQPRVIANFSHRNDSDSNHQQDASSRRQDYAKAQQIIAAVASRRKQLLKLAQCAADHQSAFLTSGEVVDLRPLPMQEASKMLSVTPAMISHIVANKYFLLGGRIYTLKLLFAQATVGGTATAAVCEHLQDITKNEDCQAPYSDAHLQKLLRQRGISLSRRTISKYRAASGILRASMRKRVHA